MGDRVVDSLRTMLHAQFHRGKRLQSVHKEDVLLFGHVGATLRAVVDLYVVEEFGSVSGAASVAERIESIVKAPRITFDDGHHGDADEGEEEEEKDDERGNVRASDVRPLPIETIGDAI